MFNILSILVYSNVVYFYTIFIFIYNFPFFNILFTSNLDLKKNYKLNKYLLDLKNSLNNKSEKIIYKGIIKNRINILKYCLNYDETAILNILKIQIKLAKYINERIYFDLDYDDFFILDIIKKKNKHNNINDFIKRIESHYLTILKYKDLVVKDDIYKARKNVKFRINFLWLYIFYSLNIKRKLMISIEDVNIDDTIKILYTLSKFFIDVSGKSFNSNVYNNIRSDKLHLIRYLVIFNSKVINSILNIIYHQEPIDMIINSKNRIKNIAMADF